MSAQERKKLRDAAYRAANRKRISDSGKKYSAANREKILTYQEEYRVANRKRIRMKATNYRAANREQLKAYNTEYRMANCERLRTRKIEYNKRHLQDRNERQKRRRDADAGFRVAGNLRSRVHLALKKNWKYGHTLELLGCSITELKTYLETQFVPGMTWENYGPVWHIDHIRPCASFNLTDPEQQRVCFNYKNLQPLFATENFKKGSHFIPQNI